MFKKVRNRLLIINLTIISLVLIITLVVIYSFTHSNMYNDNVDKLQRIPFVHLDNLREPIKDAYEKYESYRGDDFNVSFNLLVDEDGVVEKIDSNLEINDLEYQSIVDQIFDNDNNIGEVKIGDSTWIYSISKIPKISEDFDITLNEEGMRIAFLDVTSMYSTLNDLVITLIIVAVVMLVIIYFISLYFANRAIKPIEVMWNKQKQFVADATHELKTPLTIINANIDAVMINEKETVKKQKKWLEYIKLETSGMNKLINQLLLSAKSEEETYSLERVKVNKVICDSILLFESLAYERGIKIKYKENNSLVCLGDYDKLRQVVKILLDNAVKYSGSNSTINISAYTDKKYTYIKVTNKGLIPNEDLPYIFDRFYKGDKARTNVDNSYGLGLFIAKQIVNKLKGDISVSSDSETTFIMKLRKK